MPDGLGQPAPGHGNHAEHAVVECLSGDPAGLSGEAQGSGDVPFGVVEVTGLPGDRAETGVGNTRTLDPAVALGELYGVTKMVSGAIVLALPEVQIGQIDVRRRLTRPMVVLRRGGQRRVGRD